MTLQIDSIEHVHSHNIIHGDIKPESFLFGLDTPDGSTAGRLFLIDYGLSKFYRDPITSKHIPAGSVAYLPGTPPYASLHAHLHHGAFLSLSFRKSTNT